MPGELAILQPIQGRGIGVAAEPLGGRLASRLFDLLLSMSSNRFRSRMRSRSKGSLMKQA
ncbi:MAG TPA: hypothetical protein VHW23_06830 [Kofleriaceae bacterium]|nr:hypothetical protein [Kofleriaceae bacterium]